MRARPICPDRLFVWGHRGTRALAPENTLPAFQVAIDRGLDGVELDVQLTKDGQVVVMHDQRLQRTTNGQGWLKDHTLEELNRLDAGAWFGEDYRNTRIPRFEQVLELLPARMWLNVEIKNGPIYYPELVPKTLALLARYDRLENSVVSSFDHGALAECQRLNPDVLRAPLYHARLMEPWQLAAHYGYYGVHLHHAFAVPEDVAELRRRDLVVNAWGVERPEDVERIRAAGTTGYTLDDPSWLA